MKRVIRTYSVADLRQGLNAARKAARQTDGYVKESAERAISELDELIEFNEPVSDFDLSAESKEFIQIGKSTTSIHCGRVIDVREPSSVEYGRAVSKATQGLRHRYSPFEVELTHFNKFSTASDGYKVILEEGPTTYQWIIHKSSGGRELVLYGPFENEDIKRYSDVLNRKAELGKFANLDDVMKFLNRDAASEMEE